MSITYRVTDIGIEMCGIGEQVAAFRAATTSRLSYEQANMLDEIELRVHNVTQELLRLMNDLDMLPGADSPTRPSVN